MAKQIIELETTGLEIGDLTFDWCKKISDNADVSTAAATLTERGNGIYILGIDVTEDTDFRVHITADATKYAVGILSNIDGNIASSAEVAAIPTNPLLDNDARVDNIEDLIKSAEIIHGSVSDLAPTDTVFKVILEAPFDNVQLFDKKAITFIDGDNNRMSQAIDSATEVEAGVFELEFLNPWPAAPSNGDAFLLRFDTAFATREAIAGLFEDLIDPNSGLALEASVQAAITTIEAGSSTPAEIWAHPDRSLTAPAYVLPVMQGSIYNPVATPDREVPIFRGDTPRVTFELFDSAGKPVNYTGWTPRFGAKTAIKDTAYAIAVKDATWTNAAKGQGYFDLTAAETAVSRTLLGELALVNGAQHLTAMKFTLKIMDDIIK